MIPEGERYQASLGGLPQTVPAWILEALRGVGLQYVTVRDVDYFGSRVLVYNSNGARWARVLKSKTSGTLAGESDMPNVGDLGVVEGINGDEKSCIWMGAVNSVEPSRGLDNDANFVSASDLVHRRYSKHETGSYTILNKLGNFFARFMKRAAHESDAATKNLDIRVGNDGTLSLTQYKADGSTLALTVSVSQDGSMTVENDGHQVAMIATAGSEIFRYKHKKKDVTVQVTQDGDVTANAGGSAIAMEQASGDISLNHKSGTNVAVEQDAIEAETADGSTILLGKDQGQIALSTGESVVLDHSGEVLEFTAKNMNLDGDAVALGSGPVQQPLMAAGFFVNWNIVRTLLASHSHPGPNVVSASLAVLAVPDIPNAGDTVTAQVSGS